MLELLERLLQLSEVWHEELGETLRRFAEDWDGRLEDADVASWNRVLQEDVERVSSEVDHTQSRVDWLEDTIDLLGRGNNALRFTKTLGLRANDSFFERLDAMLVHVEELKREIPAVRYGVEQLQQRLDSELSSDPASSLDVLDTDVRDFLSHASTLARLTRRLRQEIHELTSWVDVEFIRNPDYETNKHVSSYEYRGNAHRIQTRLGRRYVYTNEGWQPEEWHSVDEPQIFLPEPGAELREVVQWVLSHPIDTAIGAQVIDLARQLSEKGEGPDDPDDPDDQGGPGDGQSQPSTVPEWVLHHQLALQRLIKAGGRPASEPERQALVQAFKLLDALDRFRPSYWVPLMFTDGHYSRVIMLQWIPGSVAIELGSEQLSAAGAFAGVLKVTQQDGQEVDLARRLYVYESVDDEGRPTYGYYLLDPSDPAGHELHVQTQADVFLYGIVGALAVLVATLVLVWDWPIMAILTAVSPVISEVLPAVTRWFAPILQVQGG